MVSFSGDRLKEERKRLGLTQAEFAKLADITTKTQGIYERGQRVPDTAYLGKIDDAGADIFYILIGNYQSKKNQISGRVNIVSDAGQEILDIWDASSLEGQFNAMLALKQGRLDREKKEKKK